MVTLAQIPTMTAGLHGAYSPHRSTIIVPGAVVSIVLFVRQSLPVKKIKTQSYDGCRASAIVADSTGL